MRQINRAVLNGAVNAAGVTRLVMDEYALHEGHQYATVAMDKQRLRVLWVGEGRSRATLMRLESQNYALSNSRLQ